MHPSYKQATVSSSLTAPMSSFLSKLNYNYYLWVVGRDRQMQLAVTQTGA